MLAAFSELSVHPPQMVGISGPETHDFSSPFSPPLINLLLLLCFFQGQAISHIVWKTKSSLIPVCPSCQPCHHLHLQKQISYQDQSILLWQCLSYLSLAIHVTESTIDKTFTNCCGNSFLFLNYLSKNFEYDGYTCYEISKRYKGLHSKK